MPQMKCFENVTPLTKYLMEKSLRLTQAQQGMFEESLKDPAFKMLGDPIVLQLLSNLMQLIGAKKVLDVGVYTGASSLSAALAVPDDGKVYALDVTDKYLAVGRPFWKEAGVEHKIDLILAPALETLQKFIDAGESGTFDFAFIDADKTNYVKYYEKCLMLVRSGGIIAIDNTIWDGRVIMEESHIKEAYRESTKAIKDFNDHVKNDQRINISFLTVGDGLTLCFKK